MGFCRIVPGLGRFRRQRGFLGLGLPNGAGQHLIGHLGGVHGAPVRFRFLTVHGVSRRLWRRGLAARRGDGGDGGRRRGQRVIRPLLQQGERPHGAQHDPVHRRRRPAHPFGLTGVVGPHRLGQAVEHGVMRADDLRGEHLFLGIAGVESGESHGGGGEAFGVFGRGFISLGSDRGREGAEDFAAEGGIDGDGRQGCGFHGFIRSEKRPYL